jgi:thiol-disulfide isomerase/thioredoxin
MKKKLWYTIAILVFGIILFEYADKVKVQNSTDITALSAFSNFPDTFPVFSASDLDGNIVSNEIFSKADVTVLNFWGTYCNPCVDELDELGEWAAAMPDNVQLIGIVVDVKSQDDQNCSTAVQIVEETGADYVHLIAADAFNDILEEMVAVPTTFFVDSEGEMVAEPVIGADIEAYKQKAEEYLDENK